MQQSVPDDSNWQNGMRSDGSIKGQEKQNLDENTKIHQY